MPGKPKKKTTGTKKKVTKKPKTKSKKLTKRMAVEGLKKILGQRLMAKSAGHHVARAVLKASMLSGSDTGGSAPPQTGYCRYVVDDVTNCVGDITKAECEQIFGGDYSQVPCDITGGGGSS